jgi:hypothetical protein
MIDIIDIGIIGGLLTPIYLFIFNYVKKNEHRLTRLEIRCITFHGDDDNE